MPMKGGASSPSEPDSGMAARTECSPHPARTECSPHPACTECSPHPAFPVRRKLPHGPPPFPVIGPIVQFVTINAEWRGGAPFLPIAEQLLESARFYQSLGRWFIHLLLIMPDHIHILASFPNGNAKEVCGAWKRYAAGHFGVAFQSDCFEHRVRNATEYADKWHYVFENPVRKGLVDTAYKWPYRIAFDPRTGQERAATGIQEGGASSPSEP